MTGRAKADGRGSPGGVVRRILTGQGGIQLVTALTAAGLHAREGPGPPAVCEDVLVIHGLHARPERVEPFAQAIRTMAEALHSWKAIVHIDPAADRSLAETLRTGGSRRAAARLRDLAGVQEADELYLIRNTGLGNEVLLRAYPAARKICFGDGIGLYFPDRYLAPRSGPDRTSRLGRARAMLGRFRARLGGRVLPRVPFDVGYFSLPDALGTRPPMPVVPVAREELLTTLAALRDRLRPGIGARLRQAIRGRPATFLLTSNFSEAGRMDPGDEIQAYAEVVDTFVPGPRTVGVVKPHPRDGADKIAALRAALAPLFDQVLILEDGDLAFLPFELVLMDGVLGAGGALSPPPPIVTVSSACLSLALLFGMPACLGFGEGIVRRRFRPPHVENRLREEADLRAALRRMPAGAVA